MFPGVLRLSTKKRDRILAASLLASVAAVGLVAPHAARAQTSSAARTSEFNIPPRTLSDALTDFGRQSGMQVNVNADQIRGRSSPGVAGRMSNAQALSHILAGTGLTWRLDNGFVTLTPAPRTAQVSDDAQGGVDLGPLRVDGEQTGNLAAAQEAGAERDARKEDAIYDRDVSASYAGREEIERYRGTNPADVLKGMVNVFSGDARNSGAIDPSIRGIQGPGRVPVIIDGTEQALTVWRGYNGASNRSYIDPSLISGVEVLKGPVSERGVRASTGGAVVINTLDVSDILKPGQTFGLELKLEGGNNSTNPRWPTLLTGQDYRTVPGFLGDGTIWSSPTYPYADPSLRVNLRTPDDNEAFSFGDRAIRLAAAGRVGDLDLFGAYAFRERGNYFSGKHEAGYYQQEGLALLPNNYVRLIGLQNEPGNEVPNTSNQLESFLFKATWHIADDQAIQFGFRDSKSRYGEIMPSRILSAFGFGNVQWPESKVHAQAYNAEYKWQPDSPWIDFQANLWGTHTVSDTYSAGGFPNSASTADPILINTALTNARNNRWGVTASNKVDLSSTLNLTLEGNWQHEKLRTDDEYSTASANGWRQLPRAGRREEYRINLRGEWRPVSFLKLDAGLTYSGYWAKDDFLPELIALSGGSIRRLAITSYNTSYRVNENGQIRTIAGPVWAPGVDGNYRRADNICLNGFLDSVANSTGWCGVTLNQTGIIVTEASRQSAHGWTPSASATVYLSGSSRIYARYAESLRFPSLFESTVGFSASINPLENLKPERMRSWEIAAIQDFREFLGLMNEGQRADVKLNWYHNTARNVIERNNSLMFTNLNKQTISGFELQARFDSGRIFAEVGASHMTTNKVCDESFAATQDIPRGRVPNCVKYGFPSSYLLSQATPETAVNLTAGARFFDRRLEIGGRAVWYSAYDNPQLDMFVEQSVSGIALNVPYTWDEILTLDAYVKFRLNDRFSAELAGTNLTDRYYLDPLTRSLNPAPGRTVRLSLTGRF